MKQLNIDFTGETHQPHSLVLDLGDKGSVVLTLSGNKLGDKVLTISFSHGLTLTVKYIGQVIMVLLLGIPHLNVR